MSSSVAEPRPFPEPLTEETGVSPTEAPIVVHVRLEDIGVTAGQRTSPKLSRSSRPRVASQARVLFPINRDIPIRYNLSRNISSQVLIQLHEARQTAKLQGHRSNIGDPDLGKEGQSPTNRMRMDLADIVPKESRGIALGMPRCCAFAKPVPRKHSTKKGKEEPRLPSAESVTSTAIPLPGKRASLPTYASSIRHSFVRSEKVEEEIQPDAIESKPSTTASIIKKQSTVIRSVLRKQGEDGSAPPSRSSENLSERKYGPKDFVFIRKVNGATTKFGIYQATLVPVAAVRRRLYAIKVFVKKTTTQKEAEAIKKERMLHMSICNRFCAQVLATFSDSNCLYMVLEWAPSSLRKLCDDYRTFTEEQSRFLLCELTLGLAYLHSKSIVHRNLSPHSLLITNTGHLKISNFSASATIGNGYATDTAGVRLTRYTAPEILIKEKHTVCADWFSVGTILYEMLTGIFPFGMGNCIDAIAAQLTNRTTEISHKSHKGRNNLNNNSLDQDSGLSRLVTAQLPIQYRNISEIHNLSRPAEDLVRRLMEPDPGRRLTSLRGSMDVKAHPWFRMMNCSWKDVEEGKLAPFHVPRTDEDEARIADALRDDEPVTGVMHLIEQEERDGSGGNMMWEEAD